MNGVDLIQTIVALMFIICLAMHCEKMRLVKRKIYNINEPLGINILTRLRLGFSNLCEHKLKGGL